MADEQVKQRFYPFKPKNREGFKSAVAWLGGRELLDSLKGTIIYAIYGENMDPRSWMKANIYPNVENKVRYEFEKLIKDQIKDGIKNESAVADEYKKLNYVEQTETISQIKEDSQFQNSVRQAVNKVWTKKVFDQWEWKRTHFRFWEKYLPQQNFWNELNAGDKKIDEFWFDYIADTGDGQVSVYGVACMCLSDLWLTENEVGAEVRFAPPKLQNDDGTSADEAKNFSLLPRGNYLFVGGDTAYHSANYATLFERFQTPFRWAFMSVRRFASKNYVLKRTASEKFFLLDGTRKNVFDPETNLPIDEWDGTIGDEIGGKLYWDTEPLRPLFGVPANHDYYDSIDGFNKQFRRPPFEEIEENMVYEDDKGRMFLQIPTFSREQEASYVALRLPFDWWMFGIDSENEKLDYRQELFFKQIMKNKPSKMILTTPEPTTVFGKLCKPKDKTANYLRSITESLGLEQPFFTDGNFKIVPPEKSGKNKSENIFEKQLEMETEEVSGKDDLFRNRSICRLDISGDIHHYARYWGENTRNFDDFDFASENYASIVAGGGGAFFDSTETLIGEAYNSNGKRIRRDGNGDDVKGEIPPQKVYPPEKDSLDRMSDRLFDLWIIKKGGYVQWAGVIFAVIIFFLATRFTFASKAFEEFNLLVKNLKDSILQTGVAVTSQNIQSGASGFFSNYTKAFLAGIFLTTALFLIFLSAYRLNQLIKKLREKSAEETIDEDVDGGIVQLLWTFSPFVLAAAAYIPFIAVLPEIVKPFTKSFFLLLHFVITGALVWLAFDYSNWLPVRFKIARGYSTKTFSQILEDPNIETKELYKQVIGQLSREFSYRDIPTIVLVFLAIANLIFGIRTFGTENLSKVFGDLLLLLVVFGGLFLVIFKLAYGTGAAYQTNKGKRKFIVIGMFHALLQLFAPFILFYYANVYFLIPLSILIFVVNGFPITASRIKTLPPSVKSALNFVRKIYSILDFQGAALIMKKNNPALLALCWFAYGSLFLAAPFILLFLFPNSPTLYSIVNSLTERIVEFFKWQNEYTPRVWISVMFSLAVVGWLGYYLSRIWFSWYLSVSLAFNGHNNEAGGAARIEDFKFILRVKVERDQLTVFVIGFDEARHELEKLKLKLVDKFTIKSKSIL